MIKIVYRAVVKQGRESEFKTLADSVLIPQAKSIKACKLFSIFQNTTRPAEFIFYELWENKESIETYYKNLIRVLGKNKPGSIFPEKFNAFIEEDEDILHEEA